MTELLCVAVPTESDVLVEQEPKPRTIGKAILALPTEFDISVEQEPKPRTVGKAMLAFVVGTLLSLAAWISMQGWAVCSILLFGDFSRGNMWKHILFSILGSLIVALVWRLSFTSCFRGDDDVQDFGQLGFIVGYILSGCLGIIHSNDFDKFLPLVIISWALLTLLRNYIKKEKRDENEATVDFLVGNDIV